jgi:hypothetical protein
MAVAHEHRLRMLYPTSRPKSLSSPDRMRMTTKGGIRTSAKVGALQRSRCTSGSSRPATSTTTAPICCSARLRWWASTTGVRAINRVQTVGAPPSLPSARTRSTTTMRHARSPSRGSPSTSRRFPHGEVRRWLFQRDGRTLPGSARTHHSLGDSLGCLRHSRAPRRGPVQFIAGSCLTYAALILDKRRRFERRAVRTERDLSRVPLGAKLLPDKPPLILGWRRHSSAVEQLFRKSPALCAVLQA